MTRFAPGTNPKEMAEITAAIQNKQNPKESVPVKSSSGMGKPAPVPAATPVRTPTGGGKPAPAPVPVKSSSGMGKPAPVPAATPVRTPPVSVSQQVMSQNANAPSRPTMANATGPMTPVRGGGMAPASVATMMKKGGKIKAKSSYSSGGGAKSTASKRADGCAQRGKTKGRMV